MHNDVIDLRDFYASPTGRVARRIVRGYVRAAWPDLRGLSVAGVGYAAPYLRPFLAEAARTVAVMPAPQGVIRWPADGPNAAALAPAEDLPLPDLSVDRALLVHAVECTERVRRLLREVWRAMADDGRVLIVVPNRRGIWARLDHTPFGHGHPYTPRQLTRLLRDNLLVPERPRAGLFVPPTRSRMLLGAAPAIEKAGARWFQTVGGLLFVEARKQIYAAAAAGRPAPRRAHVRVVGAAAYRPPRRGGSAPRQQEDRLLAPEVGAGPDRGERPRPPRPRQRQHPLHP